MRPGQEGRVGPGGAGQGDETEERCNAGMRPMNQLPLAPPPPHPPPRRAVGRQHRGGCGGRGPQVPGAHPCRGGRLPGGGGVSKNLFPRAVGCQPQPGQRRLSSAAGLRAATWNLHGPQAPRPLLSVRPSQSHTVTGCIRAGRTLTVAGRNAKLQFAEQGQRHYQIKSDMCRGRTRGRGVIAQRAVRLGSRAEACTRGALTRPLWPAPVVCGCASQSRSRC